KEGPVDLIVSDILMPRMDGFQLCREVKKNDQLKKIAFIFYTATYVDKKDEAFALSLGAEKFMVKPTEPEVFLKILEEVVHNYQQGATNPPGEPMEEEEAYLTQYNSRLIQKLEKKMLDLEGLHGQLKISEEKYRTVVEGANEAILVAQEDRVTYVNPKALDLFGYSKEEIISRLFVEFIHLEDRAMVQDSHQRRVAGNHITPIYSFRIISRNGLIKWVEIHSQRIFWEGKPATLNFLTDITGRREAEEALQASERKYRKLHESMRDGFVSVSMDGRITEYNEAYLQMLGYEPEEIVTRTYMDLTPEKWQVLEAEIVEKQVLPRGYSDIYEKEYRRQDGQIFPVELRTFLLRDEVGNPSAMWAIVRDITER
ncbi:MAG: hypothetical protein C0407_18845, partial [Desulfobacca sp.]|nr:hypothetical protein [Desulfobacca sp.]